MELTIKELEERLKRTKLKAKKITHTETWQISLDNNSQVVINFSNGKFTKVQVTGAGAEDTKIYLGLEV